MFVLRSKYNEALERAVLAELKLDAMAYKWNRLVDTVNSKGGQEFLDHGVLPRNDAAQFTPEEIQKLVMLCHPDKHDGKPMAVELTQKLLKMKNGIRP